ncbi:CNNM domain-containing protein [Actinomadura luteofluorescens]|uniref:CNNM domain-containing protein n=1 Tax=Actinomadura luteofluorescens TaxID=46163 RepID=UPI0036282B9C
MDPLTSLLITAALLLGNGFFVAAEFALVAANRPQLERAAAKGSRPAVAAVAGVRELSLMLAARSSASRCARSASPSSPSPRSSTSSNRRCTRSASPRRAPRPSRSAARSPS